MLKTQICVTRPQCVKMYSVRPLKNDIPVCRVVTPYSLVGCYQPFVVTFCLHFQERKGTALKSSQSYDVSVWRLLENLSIRGSPAVIDSGYMHDKRVGEDATDGRRSLCLILFSFSTSVIWHRIAHSHGKVIPVHVMEEHIEEEAWFQSPSTEATDNGKWSASLYGRCTCEVTA